MTTDELLLEALHDARDALGAAASDLSIASAIAARNDAALATEPAVLADAVEAEIRALSAVLGRR